MRNAGIKANERLRFEAENLEEAGYYATLRLIECGEPFDAIFACSDLIAIGALSALSEHGIGVPGDVSVVGFDDIPAASLVNPPLTTMHQDTAAAGRVMVEQLIRLINGEEAGSGLLVPELKVRASCGANT